MSFFLNALRAPGTRSAIECAAPTQLVVSDDHQVEQKTAHVTVENVTTFSLVAKPRLLDRWLDKVVEWSGSEFTFFTLVIALLVWAFMGIRFGQTSNWQIVISDAQAIINMVFDAFLMRQQLNAHDSLMTVAACLRSRTISHKRMLRSIIKSGKYEKVKPTEFLELQQTEYAAELPDENWFGRMCTVLSKFMGHIATVAGFWICIFIWIGFGAYCGWTNTWQLYINSGTSGLMVFILAFLANIRERHSKFTIKRLDSLYKIDSALELKLRMVSGDTIANPPVTIPSPKRGRIQRGIDYYADLVGTLLGIGILVLVMIIWVVIGPVMSFDSNWWLLIGTYAGLIGLNDGFVLDNIDYVQGGYADAEFALVNYDDLDMLEVIGVTHLEEESVVDNSLTCRISMAMTKFCSHRLTVVSGGVLIVALLIGASAMGWSVTGQLICNIPPSIIESFFMMVLITGHNTKEARRRVELNNVYLRRLKLITYLNTLVKMKQEDLTNSESTDTEVPSQLGVDPSKELCNAVDF